MDDLALTPFDSAIGLLLLIATARGLYTGLVRESFSLAGLAATVMATRYGTGPAVVWLESATDGRLDATLGPWVAGAAIALGTLLLIALVGRLVRRSIHFAGLSWADRLGGAALGLSEGALVALVILFGFTFVAGRDNPLIADSRSLAAYDRVQEFVGENADSLPSVATPGLWD